MLKGIGIDFEAKSKLLGEDAMAHIIQNVDKILVKLGKQWVFVFDQVNTLFARPKNQSAKNLDGLEYPYNLVGVVQKAGPIMEVDESPTEKLTSCDGFFCFGRRKQNSAVWEPSSPVYWCEYPPHCTR